MKLRQFEYVVEIARHKSISKAAETLYITQPTLSEALNDLEKKLGFAIFKRSRKGVELTLEGERFLKDITTILEIAKGWKEIKQSSDELIEGSINIAVAPSIIDLIFKNIIIKALECNPKIMVNMQTVDSSNMPNVFDEIKADIIISSFKQQTKGDYFELIQKNDLEYKMLFKDKFYLVVGAQHPLAAYQSMDIDIIQEYVLAIKGDVQSSSTIMEYFIPYWRDNYINVFGKENVINMVMANKAVSLFTGAEIFNDPRYLMKKVKVLDILGLEEPPILSYCMIYPNEKNITPVEKVMVDYIGKYCNKSNLNLDV